MKYKFVLTFFLLILMSLATITCRQKPTAPTDDNPFDPQNPQTQGDPFHLQASIANGGIELQWNIPHINNLAYFYIYRKTETENEYKKIFSQESDQNTYIDRNISNGHTYWYKITAADYWGQETDQTNVAAVQINTQPVLVINGDDPYTNSPTVSLTILAGAARRMMLSNQKDFQNDAWEPYRTYKTWQLTSGDGEKTVYLKVQYDSGETSSVTSDRIILDGTPPVAILDVLPDSGITGETEFQFDPTRSRDNIAATSQLQIRLDFEGDGVWDTNRENLNLFTHTFTRGGGHKCAVLQVQDLAGNRSDTTVCFYVNTRPMAVFVATADANNDHLYHFDAGGSDDEEDGHQLLYRWDWQGDGAWDTPFSDNPKADYTYPDNGTYHPTLEVKDSGHLTATYSLTLKIGFSISFEKTFGGNDMDLGNDVQQTPDGGYAIVGFTRSFGAGNYDLYLIKTDDAGNQSWAKTFGGSDLDVGNALQITTNGEFVITGSTQSKGSGVSDVWLLKTDDRGTLVMDKTFGGPNADEGNAIALTPDGGFIIVGTTQSFGAGGSDIWLIKTDANGNKIWDRTYGGTDDELGFSVQPTYDGGFVVAGATKSFGAGDYDIWLIKTDANGRQIWAKTFGGSLEDIGYAVLALPDGNFALCGLSQSEATGNLADARLIKVDANGSKIWDKTFGGNGTDEAYSLRQTVDKGFILAGYTDSFGNGNGDLWLVKTDQNGKEEWNKTVGGSNFDKGKCLQVTNDGGYVITGYTSSSGYGYWDVWLLKIR